MRRLLAGTILALLLAGCTASENEGAPADPSPDAAERDAAPQDAAAPSPTPAPASPTPASPTPATPRPTPTPSAPPQGPGNATNASEAEARVTERSFDLLLSQASLAGPSPEGETNCVKIGAVGGGRILGGNATATWTAAAPTSETLVLGFRSGYVPKLEEASGASPLSLAIPESMVPPTGPDNGFGMSFDTGQPRISLHVPRDGVGVALRQEVTLTLRIESTGDELEFEVVQC